MQKPTRQVWQSRPMGTTSNMGKQTVIKTKWEIVDGRRVRLWMVYPKGGWKDAATHPPLLLIHGLGCSVEAWKPTMESLAEIGVDRPIITFDMPGYGKSPGPREALGMADLGDWITRLMDVLGIPRAHFAGNSMGCQVALALARRHPDRVNSLVLAGATDGTDVAPLWRQFAGLVVDAWYESMLYNGTLIRMYLQMGPRRYFATVRKMTEDAPVDCAGEVIAPTLIVRGARDGIVSEFSARTQAARLPRGAYIEIPASAHAVQFNAPDKFSKIALAFWQYGEASPDVPPLFVDDRMAEDKGMVAGIKAMSWQERRHLVHVRLGSEYTRVDDGKVRYRIVRPLSSPDRASAPVRHPVILLHGLAGSSDVWIRSLRTFAQTDLLVPVFAPDQPACGASDPALSALDIPALGDWVVRFMDSLSLERAHFAANSMGCQVALALACRYPERAASLLLVGPSLGRSVIPAWRYLLGFLVNNLREAFVFRYTAAQMFLQMGVSCYIATARHMLDDDTLATAACVTTPALIVRGAWDAIIPEIAAKRLAATLPNSAFREVDKAAHVVPFNSPLKMAEIALNFWAQAEREARETRVPPSETAPPVLALPTP